MRAARTPHVQRTSAGRLRAPPLFAHASGRLCRGPPLPLTGALAFEGCDAAALGVRAASREPKTATGSSPGEPLRQVAHVKVRAGLFKHRRAGGQVPGNDPRAPERLPNIGLYKPANYSPQRCLLLLQLCQLLRLLLQSLLQSLLPLVYPLLQSLLPC
jgi:hypothetical protein